MYLRSAILPRKEGGRWLGEGKVGRISTRTNEKKQNTNLPAAPWKKGTPRDRAQRSGKRLKHVKKKRKSFRANEGLLKGGFLGCGGRGKKELEEGREPPAAMVKTLLGEELPRPECTEKKEGPADEEREMGGGKTLTIFPDGKEEKRGSYLNLKYHQKTCSTSLRTGKS